MPLELIADRPGHAVLSSYQEPPLAPDEIRVQSLFSSVKHGTELRGFRADTPDASDRWDGELRLHRRGESASSGFPRRLGNMCLGAVVEVGAEVTTLREGDRVFAHLPIRETHTVAAARVQKPRTESRRKPLCIGIRPTLPWVPCAMVRCAWGIASPSLDSVPLG